MQSVEAWLQANGVTVQGVQTETATGANADGSVVVGRLANGNAYIARVVAKPVPSVPLSPSTPAPSSSTSLSGLIDVQAFAQGLARVAVVGGSASRNADLAINDLHSNPMRGLIPTVGQSAVWT
ncbi:hypothetical protein ACIQWO_26685, partial [Pandoraea sp. NPDC090278]